MHEPRDAAAEALSAPRPRERLRWWIRLAPGPEAPDSRDRRGAQAGMALALAGATLFWMIVAGVILLLRH